MVEAACLWPQTCSTLKQFDSPCSAYKFPRLCNAPAHAPAPAPALLALLTGLGPRLSANGGLLSYWLPPLSTLLVLPSLPRCWCCLTSATKPAAAGPMSRCLLLCSSVCVSKTHTCRQGCNAMLSRYTATFNPGIARHKRTHMITHRHVQSFLNHCAHSTPSCTQHIMTHVPEDRTPH